MFSNLSASSISLATVTPSLVIRGAPKLLSSTTLRPLGPSVTFTASARMSTPRSMRSRASAPKRTSLAAMCIIPSLIRDRSRARGLRRPSSWPRGVPSTMPMMSLSFMIRSSSPSSLTSVPDHLPNRMRSPALTSRATICAGLVAGAGAGGDDLAFHRLFLGGVGDDDAARGLLFGIQPADHDPVVQGTELHAVRSRFV